MNRFFSGYRKLPLSDKDFQPIDSSHTGPSSTSNFQGVARPHEKTCLIPKDGTLGGGSLSAVTNPSQKDLQPKKGFFAKYFGCFTTKPQDDDERFFGGFDGLTEDEFRKMIASKTPTKAPTSIDSYQNPKTKKDEPYL
ncbi:MAG: hypothetical protein ACOYK6_00310 [Chthoniobacterales bacterium]